MVVAGQTYLAFLRSPYAHARIVSIDVDAARAMPGVLAVYTGAELAAAGVKPIPSIDVFKRADGKVLVTPARRALAHERVRFVGEAVAAVVAETREAARDACEAVMVDFDELPAVVDAVAATAPGAAVIDPDAPDNIAAEMRHGNAAATATAFAGAAHVVALDLVNQRLAPSSDRAAQRARRVRPGERPADDAPQLADADRRDDVAAGPAAGLREGRRCASSSATSAAASA